MKNTPPKTMFSCYQCGVNLHINEAVCHNKEWGNSIPVYSCNSSALCKSNEADQNFVDQRIEEEYQNEVEIQQELDEFEAIRIATGSPFVIRQG